MENGRSLRDGAMGRGGERDTRIVRRNHPHTTHTISQTRALTRDEAKQQHKRISRPCCLFHESVFKPAAAPSARHDAPHCLGKRTGHGGFPSTRVSLGCGCSAQPCGGVDGRQCPCRGRVLLVPLLLLLPLVRQVSPLDGHGTKCAARVPCPHHSPFLNPVHIHFVLFSLHRSILLTTTLPFLLLSSCQTATLPLRHSRRRRCRRQHHHRPCSLHSNHHYSYATHRSPGASPRRAEQTWLGCVYHSIG